MEGMMSEAGGKADKESKERSPRKTANTGQSIGESEMIRKTVDVPSKRPGDDELPVPKGPSKRVIKPQDNPKTS
jgi:hypothetical protein